MEPLKYMYNDAFFKKLTKAIKTNLPGFNESSFLKDIKDKEWEQKELKQRMRHIAIVLKKHLPTDYDQSVQSIISIINVLKKNNVREQSFEYMLFADYVEVFGLNDFDTSMKAFEQITQFASCEYGIRPFLIQYPQKTVKQMIKWSTHSNANVRRFASEGCRPMLPWAMAIPAFKKDPTPILPILENLKKDPSEYVRRSVANNLNDISKNHPEKVLEISSKWKGISEQTNWILKHGCRTLLKKGDKATLQLFGLSNNVNCEVQNLKISKSKVKIGNSFEFSFSLYHTSKKSTLLRIEYNIYFVKKNGSLSKKIFKITENMYQPETLYQFNKTQSFKDLTTRKHNSGKHKISIVINGKEYEQKVFELI